jgi:hypothetical protein
MVLRSTNGRWSTLAPWSNVGLASPPASMMRVDPVHWLSRLAPGAGLVALRQTLVRRCYGGLGSSRACRQSANQNMTAARWQIDSLVALPRAEDLLFCAKYLFVAAMVAGVHPGVPRIGRSKHDRGAVRVRSRGRPDA